MSGKGRVERAQRAVEGGLVGGDDLGADRGAVDDFGSSRGVADDDSLRGLLDDELDVVEILPPARGGAVRLVLLVAVQADAGEADDAEQIGLELGPVPVPPDTLAGPKLEPIGEVRQPR